MNYSYNPNNSEVNLEIVFKLIDAQPINGNK